MATAGASIAQIYQDEGSKNWLKVSTALWYLRERLKGFLDKETETYHQELRKKLNMNGEERCSRKCGFKDWRQDSNQPPPLCELCLAWFETIKANHTGGRPSWNNSTPYLWPTDQWEVAKVYMPGGHKKNDS